MPQFPTLENIQAAARRIDSYIHQTPVLTCQALNEITGLSLFLKCENFQKIGAFKFRGGSNTVMSLSEAEAARGVATHSSGNHAQAIALAAKMRGIAAHIVMPESAPEIKQKAVAGYGAQITLCKPTLQARESTLQAVVDRTGATFIHPYNDPRVITGQATCAMELFQQVSDLDAIITPVGGGGLISGTALSASYLSPQTAVYGAEPNGADDAMRSFRSGILHPSVNPQTIADGLLTSLGERPFDIIKKYVKDIAGVSEAGIIRAMRMIWERMKIIVETSSAVPLGMLLENDLGLAGKRVGIIISGGNVDLSRLPWTS